MRTLLIFLFFCSFLFAQQKELKIAIPSSMTPYAFLEEENIPSGILVDFWKLWAKKNNLKIKFVPSTWQGTLDAIKNKEVDIHSGLFKNEKRAEFLEFIEPIYQSQSQIYINKELSKKIKSIKDINTYTIGIEKGSYYENYFKNNYPKVKIKQYNSFSEMFVGLKNRKIDLLIEDSLVIQRFLMKDASFNKVNIIPDFELNRWFYAAVKKDDKKLKNLVSSGLKKISPKELKELEKKWVVKDKFRSLRKSNDPLTIEERIWLSNNPNITLAITKEWIRYNFIDRDGKIKGFHLDLIKQINKNLNIKIDYKAFDSWSEAFNSAKTGKVDGILGLSWSKQREEFFNYSPSYHYSPHYIVTREDDSSINSLKDFNNKTAVTYENSIENKIIKDEAPFAKIINVKNLKELLTAISEKKADATLIESAKEIDLDKYNLKIVDSIHSRYSDLSIGTNKNKTIPHAIIKKGIKSITNEQMKALKDKWLNKKIVFTKKELDYIRNAPVLKVGVEEWPGIMGSKDGKTLNGIAGELVEKAFKISGLKVKYIKGLWSDILSDFKKGDIDILPSTIYTKQRDKYGDYSHEFLSMRHYIYVHSNNKTIKSLKDLDNKKLALVEDFWSVEIIKEKYPKIEVVTTKSLIEAMQKVLNGEVDALFEAQLVIQNKMKEHLITNLKAVFQNSLEDQSLHMFFKQGDKTLESILNKSLALIPRKEKNEIISKWLYTKEEIKEVNVAFALGRDPYILDKNFMKGIEYDLVNKILNLSSINIKKMKNVSVEKLSSIFQTDKNIDIAVSVKEKKNSNLFYSNNFLEIKNVVISRKEDNLKIDSIQELYNLKNKKIVGFIDAYKSLGDRYKNLFNLSNRPQTYKEVSLQKEQVESFLKKQTDVIVINRHIFKWFFNELGKKDISNYKVHDILPKTNIFKVAFKDKKLRDIFNKNLKQLKQTGEYKEIIDNYTKGYIHAKVKINSLISSIVGKYIFENNLVELKKVINIFLELPYIKKIEVFDIQNELILNGTKEQSSGFILTDTYHFIDNLPQKVGFIKVYFNNKLLKEYEDSLAFIPSIKKFEKLEFFDFINSVYGKFKHTNRGIDFTKEELDFIKRNRVITFSNVDWKPMSIINNNEFTGLFSDYMKIIENRTGLKFKFIKAKDWLDVLTKFEKKEIDIVPNIGDAAYNLKHGLVSNSVVNFKYAIVSNKEATYIDGLKELKGKTAALPKAYSSTTFVKKNYPEIKIVETKDIQEALKAVSKNKADVFIGHSAIAVYNVQNSFHDLKIVGLSNEKTNHFILIQDNYPQLLSIINKAISSITEDEKQKLKDKWIRTEVDTAIDYSILYRIVAIFLLILAIVLIFTRKLSLANKKIEETMLELEDSNKELESTIKNLKQTQKQLIEAEKMASLGGLVAGVAHEINTPVGIGLTGSTHLTEITSKIKKEYENKQMTQTAFENYLQSCDELSNLVTNNLEKAANLVRSFKQVAVDQASEEKRTFELKTYIKEILASLNSVLKKTNLKVKVICDKDITINSYPGAISQILTNLIMNSIIHGYKEKEEGIILIEIVQNNSTLTMIYKDDGKGIEKENLPKIFDPFFTTNREKGGSGLGLNIIYNIVTSSLNGNIKCLEKKEKGVHFEISFDI